MRVADISPKPREIKFSGKSYRFTAVTSFVVLFLLTQCMTFNGRHFPKQPGEIYTGKMAKFFGLDKVQRLFQIIKFNGGVKSSLFKLYRNDELKIGTLVGADKYGNRYYENKMYFYGRNRWIDYADHYNMDYDGSQVPAEWHRWLHYMTDDPPSLVPPVQHKWMADHVENKSGTSEAYTPYSTTRPKIQSWVPPSKSTN